MMASGARGVLSGVIAGAGAWAAHTLSGGEVTPLAGLVALTLSVALGPLLLIPAAGRSTRERLRAVDPLRVAALMLLAQGVWHLVFMVSAGVGGATDSTAHGNGAASAHVTGTAAGTLATGPMLGAHLLITVIGVAAAVGLDRSLVKAVARLASTLLPRPLVRTWRPLTPTVPAPVLTDDLPPLQTARFLTVRVLRGPPLLAVSARRG